jgi:hypothetical protein
MTDIRPFDPALFGDAAIDPDTANLNAQMIELLTDQPEWWIVGAQEARAASREGAALYKWSAVREIRPRGWRIEVRRLAALLGSPADRRLMALAGLWETWRSPAGERIRSFTVMSSEG